MRPAPYVESHTNWTATQEISRCLFHRCFLPRTMLTPMSLHLLHVVDSLAPHADSLGVALPGLLRSLGHPDYRGTVAVMDGRTNVKPTFDTDRWKVCGWQENTTDQLVDQAYVVHIHGLGARTSIAFARAARRRRTPYILAPHGAFSSAVLSRRSMTRRLAGRLGHGSMLRSAAAVQALHRVEAKELRRQAATVNIVELPYSADLIDHTTADEPPTIDTNGDGPCLLMLGPIDPFEGVVAVMKSLAEIGKTGDGWRIVLAGPSHGDWCAMLEAGVRRKGGEGRVQFSSAEDVRTQRAWLQHASLLVAGSLRIRPAVSIMQAVALGVPVLATNFVAPDELSEHLFACGPTRAALRTRLREALELEESERLAKAATARDCFKARFDWNVLATRYAALYQQVTAAT